MKVKYKAISLSGQSYVFVPPRRQAPSSLGNLLVGGMAITIMALSFSAMMGVDPTNPGGNSPVTTEVHKD